MIIQCITLDLNNYLIGMFYLNVYNSVVVTLIVYLHFIGNICFDQQILFVYFNIMGKKEEDEVLLKTHYSFFVNLYLFEFCFYG